MKYNTRCTAITVVPEDEKIFSEMATEVSIEDDGGGEFIEITQTHSECATIRIDPKEWPAIRSAVNRLMKGIKTITKHTIIVLLVSMTALPLVFTTDYFLSKYNNACNTEKGIK